MMQSFAYTARDKKGEKVSGTIDVADKLAGIRQLERMGLTPINLAPVENKPVPAPVVEPAKPTPIARIPSEMERAIARQKSYVGASVVTFLVYWLFYLPGLIVNLMYLSDANKTSDLAGQKPSGYGCLVFMLILGLLPLMFTLWLLSLF
jgi:hypothetical protein